ncbi:MAG: hypothetical protein VB093_14625, partial [Propionicimonas sp.]|nr:hypothetical protein [Propionicimonas sp.]
LRCEPVLGGVRPARPLFVRRVWRAGTGRQLVELSAVFARRVWRAGRLIEVGKEIEELRPARVVGWYRATVGRTVSALRPARAASWPTQG